MLFTVVFYSCSECKALQQHYFLQSVIYCNTWRNKARMELSDVGEHVFAAECIMMSRMNKKVITGESFLISITEMYTVTQLILPKCLLYKNMEIDH